MRYYLIFIRLAKPKQFNNVWKQTFSDAAGRKAIDSITLERFGNIW